jgi:Zn-finger nucleic acid-binding protein/predicted RNA-binding Zn-ribbon protein involved in translation (DUF1610 family)
MTDDQVKSGVYNCPNCGAAATPESVRCAYCHSSLATLVCSKCYGAIFIGMKHCPWCGENAAAGTPAEGAKSRCPRCDVEFLLVNASKNTLNECPSCGGLWVDNDTFQVICADREQQQAIIEFNPEAASAISVATAQSGKTYIPCPVCKKLMNRRQFAGCSGVIIDWCKPHGAWFDRNELRQIVQFIQSGGLGKAREREKLEIEEERHKLRDERRNVENLRALDLAASPNSGDSDVLSFLGGIWNKLD